MDAQESHIETATGNGWVSAMSVDAAVVTFERSGVRVVVRYSATGAVILARRATRVSESFLSRNVSGKRATVTGWLEVEHVQHPVVESVEDAHAQAIAIDAPERTRTDELDAGTDSHGRTPEQNAALDAHMNCTCTRFDSAGNVQVSVIGAHCHCTLETYANNTRANGVCRVCGTVVHPDTDTDQSGELVELPYVITRVYVTDAPSVLQAQAERVQANTRGVFVSELATATRAALADWVARDVVRAVQYVNRAVSAAELDSDIRDAGTRLGAWVTLQARKIQADASVFPEFVSDAPTTYAELLQATARWEFELDAAYLPVWNGASDSTIYPDAVTNMLFRFWHDYGHIANHLSFAPANETALQTMHHLPLVAAEFGVDSLEYRVYYADTIGQIEYEQSNGMFPDNQFKFVRAYLQNPRLALNTSYAA